MSGERAAVEAVLSEVGDDLEPDLFGEPDASTLRGRELIQRRAGRPKGARNKRTERTVALLLARHEDPRAVLMKIAEAPVQVLVEELGCTPLEAMQEKRLAAIGVLPYVAQKQPLAVDVTNRQVVYLNIIEGAVEQGDSDAGAGVAVRVLQNVEYQEVSDGQEQQVGQSTVGRSGEVPDAQG